MFQKTACRSEKTFIDVVMPKCYRWVCGNITLGQPSNPFCNCGKDCVLYRDCCYDFYSDQLSVNTLDDLESRIHTSLEEGKLFNSFVLDWVTIVDKYGKCTQGFGPKQTQSYRLISKCPDDTAQDMLIEKCEKLSDEFLTEVPVSYVARGDVHVAFRNMYCASCHNLPASEIQPWAVRVKQDCVSQEDPSSKTKRIEPYENLKSSCIDIKERPDIRTPFRFHCFPPIQLDCQVDQTMEQKATNEFICNSYTLAIHLDINNTTLTFRNPHCIACPHLREPSELECASLDDLHNLGPELLPKWSVPVLFNFRNGISVEINKNVYTTNSDLCDSNYIFDTILQTCTEIVCPTRQKLGNSGCIYDESSWNFVLVQEHERNTARSYSINCCISLVSTTLNISNIIKEILGDFKGISFDVTLSECDLFHSDTYRPSTTRTFFEDSTENEISVPTRAVNRTQNDRNLTRTTPFDADNTTSRPTTTVTPERDSAMFLQGLYNEPFPDTSDNDTSSPQQPPSPFSPLINYKPTASNLEIRIHLKGQINDVLGEIVQKIYKTFGDRILSSIDIQNSNAFPDCDYQIEENVLIHDVVKLNRSYFGIDNTSRTLVDIDMSMFTLSFQDGQIPAANLSFCKIKLLNCTMGRYKVAEFRYFENGTLLHKVSKRFFAKGKYLISGSDVLACIDVSATIRSVISPLLDHHDSLTSRVLESISVACLIITGIFYLGCCGINTSNRSCIMFLSFTLAIAQGLFLIPIDTITSLCKAKAIALHFFWLSSFFWMLVIGYDYAKTFRVDKVKVRQTDKSVTVKYVLFSFGIPSAFILVCGCVDELIPGRLIGYGMGVCWIGKQTAYRIVFAVPVMTMIILNCLFFVCTVVGIQRANFNNGTAKSARKRNFIVIYMKLSLIMGLTWIFGFIAGLTDITVLWFFHIILNSLQGLDIFIMFVLTKSTIQKLWVYKAVLKVMSKRQTNNASQLTDLSSATNVTNEYNEKE